MPPITIKYAPALPAGNYSAIPGDPALGGALSIDDPGGFIPNSIDLSYLHPPISLGNRDNPNGPIVGIGIAADSPVSEVDLWLGDPSNQNRVRIGVGRPWFGDTSQLDTINVTFPRALPRPFDTFQMGAEGAGELPAGWTACNAVFDSIYGQSAAGSLSLSEHSFQARLELYRGIGQFPVPVRRAPYVADLVYRLKTKPYARLFFATDGRSIVDVNVLVQPAAGSFPEPPNNVTVIVRCHDPVNDIIGTTDPARESRHAATTVLDTQALAGVTSGFPSSYPTYKQSFVVPSAMYSVTVVNSSVGAAAGNGIAGAISVVARDP